MSDFENASVAAANWWADHVIGGTVASAGSGADMGIAIALSVVAGVQGNSQPESKREAFVEALSNRINAALERQSSWEHPQLSIGVDYGPEPMLADAAEEAGLVRPNFPWKTNTWVYPTHVVASLGYGAQGSLVWQDPEWERPQCLSPQYTDGPQYDRLPFKCSALRYHEEREHTFDIPDPLCTAPVLDYDGKTVRECKQSENSDCHITFPDGYRSPRFHEFVGES